MSDKITLVFKDKEELDVPGEAINKSTFANKWMFKKKIRGTNNHVWTPIYDYVKLEFNKDKLDRQTIDTIMRHRDLLLIKTIEDNKLVDKYVAWGNNSRYSKTNNLQQNEEDLFYVRISSCKMDTN